MVLQVPPLELNFNRLEASFSKEGHYCIDGFCKDSDACLIVLPAPSRDGVPYMGIKPSVMPKENLSDTNVLTIEDHTEIPTSRWNEVTENSMVAPFEIDSFSTPQRTN